MGKIRASRNRTLTLDAQERKNYSGELIHISRPIQAKAIENKIINGDISRISGFLPDSFVDLLILDPPYNLNKTFKSASFKKKGVPEYAECFEKWLVSLLPKLKSI